MMDSRAGRHDVHDRVHRAHLVEVDLVDRNIVDLRLRVAQQIEGADRRLLHRPIQRCRIDQPTDRRQRAPVRLGMFVVVRMFVAVRVRLAVVCMGLMRMRMRIVRMRLALCVRIVVRMLMAFVSMNQRLVRLLWLRVGVRQMAVHQYMDLAARNPAAVHPLDPQACTQPQRGGRVEQHLGRNSGIHQRPQQHIARDSGKAVNVRNAHKKLSLLELYRVSVACVWRPYRAGPIADTGRTSFIDPVR